MSEPVEQPRSAAPTDPAPTVHETVPPTFDLPDALPPGPPDQVPPPGPRPGSLPTVPGFDILCELARGGMGVVYKARQRSLNRIVALKMIRAGELADDKDRSRFRVEAEAVARIQHPNVVQIHEIGEHDGRPFLCLEFVEGGHLGKLLDGRPHPPRPIAALIEIVARAMHVVHQHGIVHRDLKPANILLGGPRDSAVIVRDPQARDTVPDAWLATPKITDFGLAKRLVEGEKGLTPTQAILGTPEYMAPEQAAGNTRAIGPLADVYALGAILYEGLTGRPPFEGAAYMETLQLVMTGYAKPPSRYNKAVPRSLETICLKCLSREPADRYASAEALADDLKRFLAGEPIRARPPGPVARGWHWLRKHPTAVTAGAVVLLLIAVALWLRRPPEEKPLPDDAEVRQKAAVLRRALAAHVVKTASRNGWIQHNPDPKNPVPDKDMWTHAQGLTGLIANPDATAAELRALLPLTERPYEPGQLIEVNGVKYGWPGTPGLDYPRIDPALWMACSLARGLSRPEFLTKPQRQRWQARFIEVQEMLRFYRPPQFKGGWNMMAGQKNPDHVSCYESTLALFALTEARRADLPWEGSTARRDELLRTTAQWLLDHFRDEDPAGWRAHVDDPLDPVYDGLTLKAYAGLLRAEEQGAITLPPAVVAAIPKHLASCGRRSLNYPVSTIVEGLDLTTPAGREMPNVPASVRAQWYPWALEVAVRWLRRGERTAAADDELTAARRTLAHLIVELGDETLRRLATGQTFLAAETLYALSEVPPP
jgi:predicted Ser/Thr protein kinase